VTALRVDLRALLLANGARGCENAASGGLVVRRLGGIRPSLAGVEAAERSYECELSELA
jgi:hypothetical protein